jgi:type II secretory pathway pseudopilin PulG
MNLGRALAQRREQRPHDEAGFTLAELIVAIAIEALIFGALATAFVVLLHGGTQVNDNLTRSSDARFAANYLISDARNSSGPDISLINTTTCPDPTPPVAGTATPVALFGWRTLSSSGVSTANLSNYVLVNGSLLRRHCEGGVLTSDLVLAGNIGSVTVACDPVANCSGDPTSITVTITETAETVVDPRAPVVAPYSYSLTAAFRQRVSSGSALPPSTPHPVILLGGPCGGASGVSVIGSGTMRVYGDAYINTADGPTCKALSIDGGGSYSAGSTSILTGGSCFAGAGLTCPPYSAYSPALVDPYASLPVPSTSGMTNRSDSCSSYGDQTALPGVYANPFSPGGGATCTLASGIYVLRNGLNTNNGGITIKSAAGGVLIYTTGGSFVVSGGSSINIAAQTTGPYAGIALWQAAADTNAVTFNNGGTIVISGVLYAPGAQLSIVGGAIAPAIDIVVVKTIDISNSGDLVVGTPSAIPLSINASPVTGAWTVGRPFPTTTLIPDGGDGNYTVSVTGLPPGITFNPVTLVVSGTPTTLGTTTASIKLKDDLGDDPVNVTYPITINAAPSITTVSPLPGGEVTDPYLAGISTSGGTTPFIWSQTGLPAGLTMSNTTGAITGTPTASGGFTVVVTLTDASGASVNKSLSLAVTTAPSITTASLAGGEVSLGYIATLAGSGGTTAYSWSVSPSLPSGLSLNGSSGAISGTPNGTAGTTSFTATLTDAVGVAVSKSLSISIVAQPRVVSVALTNGTGTAGTIEAGDKVTIVYSAQMSVAGFCSAWTNNAADQALVASNDVTVSIANSTTDILTVTSAICPSFTIGSINLTSPNYVSVAATFKGTTTPSKINWTTSTHTLVITLGTQATGTVANVTTWLSPIYTGAGSIKDPAGAVLANSPFTQTPTAKRF